MPAGRAARRAHADLLGVPGDGGHPRERARRTRGARLRRCAARGGALAALEQRLAERAGRAQAARLRHRPAGARRCRARATSWRAAQSPARAARSRDTRAGERVRLHALQGALPLRAAAASRSTTSSASEMLKFHPLKVLPSRPDAEDAIEIALEVPEALRAEYRGAPGQHVVVRAFLDGEEVRRTYSLVNAPGEWPLRIVPRVHAHGPPVAPPGRAGARRGPARRAAAQRQLHAARAAQPGGTYVAFAAGCGITPVLSVVRSLLASGAGARARLLRQHRHGARHVPGGAARAQGSPPRRPVAALPHEPRAAGSRALQRPPRCVRACASFAARLFAPQAVREYFICGPGDMIEHGQRDAARARGRAPGASTPSTSRWRHRAGRGARRQRRSRLPAAPAPRRRRR